VISLTAEEHRLVLRRLVDYAKHSVGQIPLRHFSLAYASLLNSFLLHNISAAETLLRVQDAFGLDWYPVASGYAVTRTMFEVDVTAHYIAKAPTERASQYIAFAAVLNKRAMEACRKHRNSKDVGWREAMEFEWRHRWAPREQEITTRFNAVAAQFSRTNSAGKLVDFQNWSGKTLCQMAREVDHLEAYDIFYAQLSSFAHADVHLADRYLKIHSDGPIWTQRANEADVGNVFRHAASFLTCYLEFFGEQFETWGKDDVLQWWRPKSDGRPT
jgi:hypothetical protein